VWRAGWRLAGQRTPTPTQLAALSYLAVAVTAVVFLAWYAAMQRLGVDRTGLFNGLIPIASLAAVALAGTGTIAPFQIPAALTVLTGVILGLRRTPQVAVGSVDSAGQRTRLRAASAPASPHGEAVSAQSPLADATPEKVAA
jgi:drug/metabolite transporter (DMT)-like permease